MKQGFYLFAAALFVLIASACGIGKSGTAEGAEEPIERTASAYTKALIGKWGYDMPFMAKEVEKFKKGVYACAKKANPNLVVTPEIDKAMDGLMQKQLQMEGWKDYKLEFSPSGDVKVLTDGQELEARIGYAKDLSEMYFYKPSTVDPKRTSVVAAFQGFKLARNAMTRQEEMKIPFGDSTLYVTHKYIRE